MAREFFKNLPDTTTPLNAQRMNAFLNGEEAMGSIVVDDIKSKNIFNKNDVKKNCFVYINTGEEIYSSEDCVSNFIDVSNIGQFIGGIERYGMGGCFYDSSKKYISGFSGSELHNGLNTPSNAKYVRFNCAYVDIDTYQVEKGNQISPFTPYIDFNYDKSRGNYTLLFRKQVNTGNTYDLLDTLQNYRYIIFMLFMGSNTMTTIYPYDALHIPGYTARVELSCYESSNNFTEIIIDLAFTNDTQVICDRCGYIGRGSNEFGNNPYNLIIYGIK